MHNRRLVEESRTRTVVIGDVRGNERYLRVTWHPGTGTLVFSHWNGAVCSASTPVHLGDATKVIDLVVRALRETVERQPSVPDPVRHQDATGWRSSAEWRDPRWPESWRWGARGRRLLGSRPSGWGTTRLPIRTSAAVFC